MKKSDVDVVTEENVRNGGLLVKMYFDMQHKDFVKWLAKNKK